jgi:chemotaxis family two-component system response regulator Rcp1
MTQPSASGPVFNPFIGRPVDILLVEDSPSDVAMTLSSFRDARIANEIHVVADGEQAMAYLRKQGPFQGVRRPDLVLLDLNLPRKDGREVLAEMKADADLKVIPVVVLTSSSAEADVLRSYELHANSYVTKPIGGDDFIAAMREIEGFWLALVHLPRDRPR